MTDIDAIIEGLSEAMKLRRTMTDPQRLLWRDDVEGICQTPNLCWEHNKTARCGPCAIEQATRCGIETDYSLPNLPEVSRLNRELSAVRARLLGDK